MLIAKRDADGTMHVAPGKQKKFPVKTGNSDEDGNITSVFVRIDSGEYTTARHAEDGHITIITKR